MSRLATSSTSSAPRRPWMGASTVPLIALALGACQTPEERLDNPLSGAKTTVAVNQDLHVRLSNMDPKTGLWSQDTQGLKTIKVIDKAAKGGGDGAALQQDFYFTGIAAGIDQLTFVYHHAGAAAGAQPLADDVIAVAVTVK